MGMVMVIVVHGVTAHTVHRDHIIIVHLVVLDQTKSR